MRTSPPKSLCLLIIVLALSFSTSTFPQNDNITLEGSKGVNYYSKSSGELTNPDTWGTEPDGGGEPPASFGLNSVYFHIVNRNLVILDSDWEVTGTGSKVVVGDGDTSTKLEVHSQLDAVVDVTSNATLELANSSLPEINDLETGSTVLFTENATNIPYNSYFNLVIDNTDPVFDQPGELIIRGDLTLSGKVNMPDARGMQEYNLVFNGEHEQLITGNGNVVRGYNVVFDKPAGTVSFGTENGGTILSSDNQITLLISKEASFDDNGITIYAGNSVNIDGDPDSFNFTGTLVLAGSEEGIVNGAGIGNNFNIRDSNNNSNAKATFNNLVIRAFNHNGEFRFRDGSGNILRVKGDLIVEAGAMGRIRFYENTVQIGGDLIIEEGFGGSVDEISTLVFDGERDQQLSVPYLISTGNLLINCAGNLQLFGELLVKNSISFESGMLDVPENSLPILGHRATISGYNEESHVKGPLGRYFRNTDPEEALFPVGKDGNYKPFAIETSHNNENTVLYVVELNNEAPPELTFPAEIINVSQDFHFTLGIIGDYDINRAYASIYTPAGQSNEGYLMSIVKSGDRYDHSR